MKKYISFTVLVIIIALSVSSSAAFFSVFGLSKLFAGASLQVIIMASTLEAAKLVIATLLHQKWEILPKVLKSYLVGAVIILVLITSAGIYGFLSNAYQLTANANSVVNSEIGIVQSKKELLSQQLTEYKSERESINKDVSDLRSNLSSGTMVEYIDKNTGQKVSTSSAAIRKSLENQLDEAITRRDKVSSKIDMLTDSISSMEITILQKQTGNSAAAELGPLIYLSRLTGMEMDKIINYFILLIILVFDPLAVSLVIASSHILKYGNLDILSQKSTKFETSDSNFALHNTRTDSPLPDNEIEKNKKKEEIVENISEEKDIFTQLNNLVKKEELPGKIIFSTPVQKNAVVDNGISGKIKEVEKKEIILNPESKEEITITKKEGIPDLNKMSVDEITNWYREWKKLMM